MYLILDGGDCNQLCDYNQCNITQTISGECINECNTTYCNYGFGEQCLFNPIYNYGQIDNYTLCQETTVCNTIEDLSVSQYNWIGDGVCDELYFLL